MIHLNQRTHQFYVILVISLIVLVNSENVTDLPFYLTKDFNLFDNSTSPELKHIFINQTTTTKTTKKSSPITGNELWDGLITDCLKNPTYSCIQKNVYSYLDSTLKEENVNISNRILFKKNRIDFHKYSKEYNEEWNEIESGRAGEKIIDIS